MFKSITIPQLTFPWNILLFPSLPDSIKWTGHLRRPIKLANYHRYLAFRIEFFFLFSLIKVGGKEEERKIQKPTQFCFNFNNSKVNHCVWGLWLQGVHLKAKQQGEFDKVAKTVPNIVRCHGQAVNITGFKLWCFWSAECGFESRLSHLCRRRQWTLLVITPTNY